MNPRRTFLGACANMASAGAVAATPAVSAAAAVVPRGGPDLTGLMGRGYARGPFGLVHFHDSVGLVRPAPGELPLLLLHQSPSSARQFEAAFAPLVQRGVRFIAVDTPGFGFSDPTKEKPQLEQWAAAFVAVMDHLGLARADVLGHHTGSMNAGEIALQFPQRVRRLILNGPFMASEQERERFRANSHKSHESGKPKLDGNHLLTSFQRRVRMYGKDVPDPAVITRIVVEKYQGLGPYTWGHDTAFAYDQEAAMRRIRHQTLILTNTGDDIYEMAQRARVLRPDFAYQELQGGSHDIVDQQPQAWADAVVAYLRRPDAAVRG